MSDTWIFVLKIIGIVVVSYFLGNLNFAEIFARARHIDIHSAGSGNPGTMNMLRTCGVGAAVATLICDVLKGAIPAVAGYFVLKTGPSFGIGVEGDPSPFLGYYVSGIGKLGMIIAGASAVVGHIVPVVNKFRGGKGVATTLGVYIAMDPFIAVGTFLIGLIYLMIGKYGCVSSFICIVSNTIVETTLAAVYHDNVAVIVLVIFLGVLVVSVHWPNIIALAKGTERDSNLLRRSKAKKAAAQAEAAQGTQEGSESSAPTEGESDGNGENTQDTKDTNEEEQ